MQSSSAVEPAVETRPLPTPAEFLEALHPRGERFTICTFNPARVEQVVTPEAGLKYATQMNQTKCVYFSLAAISENVPRGKRGEKKDVLSVGAVWTEIDPTETDCLDVSNDAISDKNQLPPDLIGELVDLQIQRVRLGVQQKRIPCPSVIVRSGHGPHVYWLLDQPATTAEDFALVEAINERLRVRLGGDSAATDITRVLRVPGTTHHKNPDRLLPCEISYGDLEQRYSLDELLAALGLDRDSARSSTSEDDPTREGGGASSLSFDQLEDYLRGNETIPQGIGHAVFIDLVRLLLVERVPASAVKRILKPIQTEYRKDRTDGKHPKEIKQRVDEVLAKIEAGDLEQIEPGRFAAAAFDILGDEAKPKEPKKKQKKAADILVELASVAELFHNELEVAYATVPVGQHRETRPLKSSGFRRWLMNRYRQIVGKTPSGSAMIEAIDSLDAAAVLDGQQHKVWVRTAEHDGRIYIDLGSPDWSAIEISADGWRVVADTPIRFRRPPGLLPLPTPESGGELLELSDLTGLEGDDFILVVAWLLMAIRPQPAGGPDGSRPYPHLALQGEQGSGKSTLCGWLRQLVDPNQAPLRSAPKNEHDFSIAMRNAQVIAYENLSSIPLWLSDCLCRSSTGGGFTTRKLYTNDEEALFQGTRPALFNGITDYVSQPDLADRTIGIFRPSIPKSQRLLVQDMAASFKAAGGRILGAIYTAMSAGLRHEPTVELDGYPRMADFARWVVACCGDGGGLPFSGADFIAAYSRSHQEAAQQQADLDPVACAIRRYMLDLAEWTGAASELLERLNNLTPDSRDRPSDWPKSARGMSGRVRRAAPVLRVVGIDVVFDKAAGGNRTRLIHLVKRSADTSDNSGRLRDG